MACSDCKNSKANNEGEAMRQHKVIKWLIIVIVIQFIAFVASNGAWLWYESQFASISTEVTQETEDNGINTFIGGDYNGEAKDKNN